ncbi:MAG TPA: hypothetical protein VJ994_06110, partial [Paracoccaceae bacterium]|nr:hypothetical protein [Paracoccaceae bacterium]
MVCRLPWRACYKACSGRRTSSDMTVPPASSPALAPETMAAGVDWSQYGRTSHATRGGPLDQITAANAGRLEVAWRFGLGDPPSGSREDHKTPRLASAGAFSSSIVVPHVATGRLRWGFRTGHRGSRDHDVPSQPIFANLPNPEGGSVPALIQLTKRGQTFLLGGRDGTPMHEVEERDAPIFKPEADVLSPTKPYPADGPPPIGTEPPSERRIRGTMPLDRLYCRIAFHRNDYAGDFTPLTTRRALIWPGFFGGMTRDSAVADEARPDDREARAHRAPDRTRSGRRGERRDRRAQRARPAGGSALRHDALQPHVAARRTCHEPPYGTLTAIDLVAREIVRRIPIGTVGGDGAAGHPQRPPHAGG